MIAEIKTLVHLRAMQTSKIMLSAGEILIRRQRRGRMETSD
jgi:hypothetical protein